MPNRYVKDRARRSPSLEALSDAGERLFWRLKLAADDYGRFEADPRALAAECFPLRFGQARMPSRCMQMYAELCGGEDPICRTYRVAGRLYGVFRKWDEEPRAKRSRFPAPPPDPGTCPTLLARDEHVPADAEHVPASALGTGLRFTVSDTEREAAPGKPAPPAPDPGVNGGGARRKSRLPDEPELTDADEAYAKGKGFDDAGIDRMFEAFCDHHWGKGTVMLDWSAAWRTWVRREPGFRAGAATRGARP